MCTLRQILILLLVFFTATTFAERQPLSIELAGQGWKNSSKQDVKAVLNATAKELWPYASPKKLDPILVNNGKGGPIVLFKRGPNNAYQMRLDTSGRYWSQHAFQFAHEFCHILCGYKNADKSNLWFEEAICETASLFALRAMGKSWKKKAPYSNWRSYADKLHEYAQERIDEHRLPEKMTLPAWYAKHADHLKIYPTDRPLNTAVAIELLPLFEANPEYWAAISYINIGRGQEQQSFATYLYEWQKNCPKEHRGLVREIIALFAE